MKTLYDDERAEKLFSALDIAFKRLGIKRKQYKSPKYQVLEIPKFTTKGDNCKLMISETRYFRIVSIISLDNPEGYSSVYLEANKKFQRAARKMSDKRAVDIQHEAIEHGNLMALSMNKRVGMRQIFETKRAKQETKESIMNSMYSSPILRAAKEAGNQ